MKFYGKNLRNKNISLLMGKNILVTGCAGFIGFHLCEFLLRFTDAKVTGIDNFSRGKRDSLFSSMERSPNFKFLQIDLNSQEEVNSLSRNYDIIFHLATINGTQNFYKYPYDVLLSASLPTLNLLNHYKNTQLKLFIHAGTPESYAFSLIKDGGPLPTPEIVDLTFPGEYRSRFTYGISKAFSEWALSSANSQYGFPFISLRYHNVYGPRMGDKHFVPDILQKIITSKRVIEVIGSQETRSFLYIDDAIVYTMLTVLHGLDTKKLPKIINIGSAEEILIKDAARIIIEEMNSPKKLKEIQSFDGSVNRRLPNLKIILSLTNYTPKFDFRSGVRRMIQMNKVQR